MPEVTYALNRLERDGAPVLELEGKLTFDQAPGLWTDVSASLAGVQKGERIDFDVSKLEEVDGGSMALLVASRADLHRRGAFSEFIGANTQLQRVIHLYRGDVKVGAQRKRKARGVLDQIGNATMAILREGQQVFGFFGQALFASMKLVINPRSANWGEVAPTMEKTGADAVPIVLLINFLIGLVMAFQGAVQLKQFGANIYVADLVGLSITRELGPLMTAIIVCGRSGAAFAAEIGSMKVSEEIDALRTMGFGAAQAGGDRSLTNADTHRFITYNPRPANINQDTRITNDIAAIKQNGNQTGTVDMQAYVSWLRNNGYALAGTGQF